MFLVARLGKKQHIAQDISSTKTRLLLKQDAGPACTDTKRPDQYPNEHRSSSPGLDDMLVQHLDNSDLL